MTSHLTDASVRRLKPPATGNKLYFDADVPGLACRVTANGSRAFVLCYVTRNSGRQRRLTIGAIDDWRATAARQEARKLRAQIDAGADPLGDIRAARAEPTMAELITRFLDEHVSRRRPSTQKDYRGVIGRYIRPYFGAVTKVADVTHADIEGLHRKVTALGRTYQANRVAAVLSKMFSLAIKWGWRSDNPINGLERNPEYRRQRYLKADELQRLLAVLADYPEQTTVNAIRLLLLTGARKGEVLAMKWADIDLKAGLWSKPAASTKQKREHEVPLSAPARQLLAAIPHHGPFVFPGSGQRRHLVEVKKGWAAICKRAGIEGVRIHDLRHSFASQLASGGASLPLIGALLGHTQAQTTQRYAHLFVDPQRAAVEKIGAVMTGTAPAELIPLKRK
jgi:integrase